MRIIPVIDLLNCRAVHAVKGERAQYKPVKSLLCDTSDPRDIARAFRDRLGLNEIYIADLGAIQGSNRPNQAGLIINLASAESFDIILDSGISDIETIYKWIGLGIHKVVIGSETLTRWEALKEIPAAIDPNRLVFSLDCRAGEIISKCPGLAASSPMKALERLRASGWKEIILLDLARVGSGSGINRSLVYDTRRNFPDLTLLAGGGITGLQEINELKSMGIEGVLIATALHQGVIGPEQLSGLRKS